MNDSYSARGTTFTVASISVCWIPQRSEQRAAYSPAGALNQVWFVRPGIASILPPSAGTHQLWRTSLSGAKTSSFTTLSAGAIIVPTEIAPFG